MQPLRLLASATDLSSLGWVRKPWRLSMALLPVLYLGCAVEAAAPEDGGANEAAVTAAKAAPGALVDVALKSRVAVLIDEIPVADRAAAVRLYLGQPTAFWVERAKRQLRHTNYRLIYRNFYYDPAENRQMLSLPPEDVWHIELAGPAKHVTSADGHDVIEVSYTFRSTIVTDPASPGAAEPNLAKVGGVWNEPFNLPLDPEFVFQRTGYACMDESGYPLGTARSENEAQLFDQDCDVETPATANCHATESPKESCLDALAKHVGRVDTKLRLERVAYSEARARAARVGTFTHQDAPDLTVMAEELANNWVEYRYIPADSCAITEQCVGGSGWRRLLLFDASINNVGAQALRVGSTDESSPPRQHNMFEFSACHEHFHFRHYGDFSFGSAPGDKRAFCVESTDRRYNNEGTPIVHEFGCENQGVAPGWGDTYIAGVECNWIDVTDVAIPAQGVTQNLRFAVNPDKFLCEGQPVLDAQGEPVYETTSFVTETGEPVGRPVCDFATGVESNNVGVRAVKLPPAGGLVTAACTRTQAGPLRDCGFAQQQPRISCRPGKQVRLSCSTDDNRPTQVVRVCEDSAKLGGTACMYRDALANKAVGDDATTLSFRCPEARDATEPGGSYSLYVAPVLPGQAAAPVKCTQR